MNYKQLARLLRFALVMRSYYDGDLSLEQTKELLNAPLSPSGERFDDNRLIHLSYEEFRNIILQPDDEK